MAYYNGKKVIGTGRLDLSSPYYEFAKSEFEKSCNVYQNNGTYLTDQQYGATGGFYGETGGWVDTKYYNNLEVGETYTAYSNGGSLNICFYDINKTFISQLWYKTIPFIVPSNAVYYRVGGYLSRGTNNDAMIIKGDWSDKTLPSYQPYNGYPLHPKDIKPVKVWENGSPNSSLSPIDLALDLSDADYINIHVKALYYSYVVPQVIKLDKIYGWYVIYMYQDGAIKRRQIQIKSTGISIEDGYSNDSVNNNSCIITKIEKGNY